MDDVTAERLDLGTLLERALEISQEVLRKNAIIIDQKAQWPEEAMRALQEAGLGGLVVPTQYGGHGFGLFSLVQLCEILGRECSSTALSFGMHCVGSAVLSAKATSEQQEQFLGPICQGKHLTTVALSEPDTGSHFYFPETKLKDAREGHYAVTGIKSFVTNGGHADSYVVSTVAAEEGGPLGQFSCILIPEGTQGMNWGPEWQGFGMRGNASRNLELKEVVVPKGNLLGEEGDQIWYIFNVVAPYFLAAMSGTYLGIASAALQEVSDHLSRRRYTHSGIQLGQQPILQHRLGTLWSMVERTRRLVYYAAAEMDADRGDGLPAIFSAKAEVAECAVNVASEAMTLMGGRAYTADSKLSRLLRDARAAHVMAPTTDMLRTWTGRALLGQQLLGD